jgi:bud site selection protein 20
LKEAPYTQKEAEAAVGLRTDNGPRIEGKKGHMNADVGMEGIELSEKHIDT